MVLERMFPPADLPTLRLDTVLLERAWRGISTLARLESNNFYDWCKRGIVLSCLIVYRPMGAVTPILCAGA